MATSYFDELLEKREDESRSESAPPSDRFVWWKAYDDSSGMGKDYIQEQRASNLMACARALENSQQEIHTQNLLYSQLYSNRELASFDWGNGALTRASMAPVSNTSENITKRVIDTLVSQIAKNRPKPKPVARGASFHVRQSIRKLDKFLYGEWQRNRLYSTTKRVFRDSCVYGFGCVKTYVEEHPEYGDRVCYERVFPDEILVDQLEIVACGKMRHLYRRRVLPVEVVAATYGVEEEDLREQGADQFYYVDYRPVGSGHVVVVEAYQANGRWMVATNNMVLDEGEWDYDWFPYVFYHYNDPGNGFYAPSVAEEVIPYQIRLNEINEVIRDAQDIMARPRIFVAEGSRVNPMEIDNVVGRFVKYTGQMPEAITWPAMSAELYNERDRQVRVCLEHFGLSNLASTVTPPPSARFDSSPAFREFNAIQDDRLSDPSQRWEEFHLQLAERTIDVIAASGANPKTVWYSGWRHSKAEELDWAEINADKESYVMTMEAVSIFSMSPASARDELEKQLGMGLITPEQYRLELSDMDTESQYSLAAAAGEDLNRVQELLESGGFENPIPEQDLVNGITQMTLALLNLGKYDDTPDEIKMAFINWITLARAIVEQGTEKIDETVGPEMGAMPGMQPGMQPGMMGGPGGALGGAPGGVPVPEAMGLASVGPGRMPNT